MINQVPKEDFQKVFTTLFSYLDRKDQLNLSLVCKKFNETFSSNLDNFELVVNFTSLDQKSDCTLRREYRNLTVKNIKKSNEANKTKLIMAMSERGWMIKKLVIKKCELTSSNLKELMQCFKSIKHLEIRESVLKDTKFVDFPNLENLRYIMVPANFEYRKFVKIFKPWMEMMKLEVPVVVSGESNRFMNFEQFEAIKSHRLLLFHTKLSNEEGVYIVLDMPTDIEWNKFHKLLESQEHLEYVRFYNIDIGEKYIKRCLDHLFKLYTLENLQLYVDNKMINYFNQCKISNLSVKRLTLLFLPTATKKDPENITQIFPAIEHLTIGSVCTPNFSVCFLEVFLPEIHKFELLETVDIESLDSKYTKFLPTLKHVKIASGIL